MHLEFCFNCPDYMHPLFFMLIIHGSASLCSACLDIQRRFLLKLKINSLFQFYSIQTDMDKDFPKEHPNRVFFQAIICLKGKHLFCS